MVRPQRRGSGSCSPAGASFPSFRSRNSSSNPASSLEAAARRSSPRGLAGTTPAADVASRATLRSVSRYRKSITTCSRQVLDGSADVPAPGGFLGRVTTKQPSLREFVIIYVVLGVSLILEGSSLRKAVTQVRQEARHANRGVLTFVLRSPDPTVKTVAGEDSVAVIGVLAAAVGTVLHQITGVEAWEGVASLVIAVLLGYVAVILGRDTKELLIGESADPVVRATAFATITSHPEITGVKEILTMQLGPASVLVAARVQFEDDLNAKRVQLVCTDIEAEMRERMPELTQVFLDPSEVTTDDLHRTRQHERQILDDVDQLNGPSGVAELRLPRSRSARRITSSGP